MIPKIDMRIQINWIDKRSLKVKALDILDQLFNKIKILIKILFID